MTRASSAATDSSSARGKRACFCRQPANKMPRSCACTSTGTQSTRRISIKAPIIDLLGESSTSCSIVRKLTSNSAGKGASGDSLDQSSGVPSLSLSATIPRKLRISPVSTTASPVDSTHTPTLSASPLASNIRTASLSNSLRGLPSAAARATPITLPPSPRAFPQPHMSLLRSAPSCDGRFAADREASVPTELLLRSHIALKGPLGSDWNLLRNGTLGGGEGVPISHVETCRGFWFRSEKTDAGGSRPEQSFNAPRDSTTRTVALRFTDHSESRLQHPSGTASVFGRA